MKIAPALTVSIWFVYLLTGTRTNNIATIQEDLFQDRKKLLESQN